MKEIDWEGSSNQGLALESDPDDYVIVLNAVGCRKCKSTAISRSRHEFVSCNCGDISADGGLEYIRRIGDIKNMISLNVTASPDVREHIAMVMSESTVIKDERAKNHLALLEKIRDFQLENLH